MGKSRIYSPCTNVDLIWKFMHSSLFRRQLDPLFRSFNAIKWTSEFRYSNKTQQQHWKYARTQVHWIFQISKYAYRHAVPNDYTRIFIYVYHIRHTKNGRLRSSVLCMWRLFGRPLLTAFLCKLHEMRECGATVHTCGCVQCQFCIGSCFHSVVLFVFIPIGKCLLFCRIFQMWNSKLNWLLVDW